ncbi:MAG: four-carbon acid sugar kinase family protein [Candidatus Sericytochromatia bacterium]|nr:four-carbon acid sugar kinase family protein [Candidatus Sericytochromatia bacterium]
MPIRIVADDLTGAAEALLAFHQVGFGTLLETTAGAEDGVDTVVARSLDLRDGDAGTVQAAFGQRVMPHPAFLAIDGLGGTPLPALLREALGRGPARLALLATAHPDRGWTTMGGYALRLGLPLGTDPRDPRPRSGPGEPHLPTALAAAGLRVWTLEWRELRRGPEAIATQLLAAATAGAQVIVADAASHDDLDQLALVALGSPFPVLPVGTAGLAGAWARALGRRRGLAAGVRLAEGVAPASVASVLDASGLPDPRRIRRLLPGRRPVLAVCGSDHPATVAQATRAAGKAGPLLLDASALLFDEGSGEALPPAWQDAVNHARGLLATGQDVVMATAGSTEDRERVLAWGRAAGLPGETVEERLQQAVALVVRQLAEAHPLSGIVALGSRTAATAWRALPHRQAMIECAAEAGLPVLRLHPAGPRLVACRGSEGQPDTLVRTIDLLRRLDGLEKS